MTPRSLILVAPLLALLAPIGRPAAAHEYWLAPADRGGLLFAYESDVASIILDASTFERYLADQGLDGPLAGARLNAWRQPFAADGHPLDPAAATWESSWASLTFARDRLRR